MKPIFKYPELILIPEASTLILILLLKYSITKWKKVAVNAADTVGKGNPTIYITYYYISIDSPHICKDGANYINFLLNLFSQATHMNPVYTDSKLLCNMTLL